MRKAFISTGLAAAFALASFGFTPAKHTNVLTRAGVTYVQRGALGSADYVATNVAPTAYNIPYGDSNVGAFLDTSSSAITYTGVTNTVTNIVTKSYVEGLGITAGLTTNDVCNIVTNKVGGTTDWTVGQSKSGTISGGEEYSVTLYSVYWNTTRWIMNFTGYIGGVYYPPTELIGAQTDSTDPNATFLTDNTFGVTTTRTLGYPQNALGLVETNTVYLYIGSSEVTNIGAVVCATNAFVEIADAKYLSISETNNYVYADVVKETGGNYWVCFGTIGGNYIRWHQVSSERNEVIWDFSHAKVGDITTTEDDYGWFLWRASQPAFEYSTAFWYRGYDTLYNYGHITEIVDGNSVWHEGKDERINTVSEIIGVVSNLVTNVVNDLSFSWSKVSGTPSSLSGYGITDAYTKMQTGSAIADSMSWMTNSYIKAESASFSNEVSKVVEATVTNVVNEVKAEFYDEPLSVNWTVRMVNGEMKLYATTNVNMGVLSSGGTTRYTNWSTDNLPSDVTWAAQPYYDDGIDLWNWDYEGGSAMSEEGGADATTLTFGYGTGFTTTRSVIQ